MRKLTSVLALCVLAGCATVHKQSAGQPSSEAKGADADPFADDLLAGLEEEFTGDQEGEDVETMPDPLRRWNVVWFHFNDKLYFWFLRPVSKGYGRVMPEPIRKGTDNFFTNIETPIPLTSCVLQGRWRDASDVLARFGLNTTVGFLGWLDVAANRYDLPKHDEDVDQAFGSWGIETGSYLVWPFFGPSSVRGTGGMVGDRLLTPTTWLSWPWTTEAAVGAANTINNTSLDPDQYMELQRMTVVPYTAMRNAYYQNRKKLVEE